MAFKQYHVSKAKYCKISLKKLLTEVDEGIYSIRTSSRTPT